MSPGKRRGRDKSSGYQPTTGQPPAARDYRVFGPFNDLRVSEMLARSGVLDRVNTNIWEPFAARYAKIGSTRYRRLLESLVAAHHLADTQHFKQISPTRTIAHQKLEELAEVSCKLLSGLMPEEAFPPVRRHSRAVSEIPAQVVQRIPSRRIDPTQRGPIFSFIDQDIAQHLGRQAADSPFSSAAAPAITLHDALRHLTALNHWLARAAHTTTVLTPAERGALKARPATIFMRELERTTRRMSWIGRSTTAYSFNNGSISGWRYEFLRAAEAHGFINGLLLGPPIRRGTTELVSDASLKKILTAAAPRKSRG